MSRCFVFFLVVVVFIDNGIFALEKVTRQKRCIVIQKQTGGKADSGEGTDDEDYDYKRPQPKAPPPDRLRNDKHAASSKNEVEELKIMNNHGRYPVVPPELLKYKKPPNKAMLRRLRLKNRLQRNNFDT